MEKENYLYLLSLNLKSNRIKKFIFSFLFILFFLIGNILLNSNFIIDNYVYQSINGSLEERTVSVYNKDLNYEDTISELKKYNEVSELYNSGYNMAYVSVDILGDKEISLKPLPLKEKKILYGTNVKDNEEIICPVYLASIEDIKTSQFIELKNYLNKYINISYNSYYYYSSSINDKKINQSYSKKLKLVGLYVPEKNMTNSTYLECYMNESEIIKINQESKNTYSKEFLANNTVYEDGINTTVILNNKKNIPDFKNKLEKNSFYVNDVMFEIDKDLVKMIQVISRIGFIVMLIFIITISTLYINNIIHDEKYNIGLYKTFGFDNNCISKVINLHIYTIVLLSYILSIIFLLFLIKIVKMILSQYIVFMSININLSIINEVFYFLFIVFVTYLCTKFTLKRITKIEAKDILSENNN